MLHFFGQYLLYSHVRITCADDNTHTLLVSHLLFSRCFLYFRLKVLVINLDLIHNILLCVSQIYLVQMKVGGHRYGSSSGHKELLGEVLDDNRF